MKKFVLMLENDHTKKLILSINDSMVVYSSQAASKKLRTRRIIHIIYQDSKKLQLSEEFSKRLRSCYLWYWMGFFGFCCQ